MRYNYWLAVRFQATRVGDTRASANPLPALGRFSFSRRRLSRYDGGDGLEAASTSGSDSSSGMLRFRRVGASSAACGTAKAAC